MTTEPAIQVSPEHMEPDMRALYELFQNAMGYIAEAAMSRGRISELEDKTNYLQAELATAEDDLDKTSDRLSETMTELADARWKIGELESANHHLNEYNAHLVDAKRNDEDQINRLTDSLTHASNARDSNQREWERTQTELDDALGKLGRLADTFKAVGLAMPEPMSPPPEPGPEPQRQHEYASSSDRWDNNA